MEVLNEIQGAAIYESSSISVFLVVLLFAGLTLAFFGITSINDGFMVAGFLILVISLIGLMCIDDKPTGKYEPTRYEVILTDENYVIDASKYKIIEKRGKIITIEEVIAE